jgi:hypothetical protein
MVDAVAGGVGLAVDLLSCDAFPILFMLLIARSSLDGWLSIG